jgi:hypothetical protein
MKSPLVILLTFPGFALVFAPFVITYIYSEHGPDHTSDYALAFGLEAAWLVFLLVVIGGLSALSQKRKAGK